MKRALVSSEKASFSYLIWACQLTESQNRELTQPYTYWNHDTKIKLNQPCWVRDIVISYMRHHALAFVKLPVSHEPDVIRTRLHSLGVVHSAQNLFLGALHSPQADLCMCTHIYILIAWQGYIVVCCIGIVSQESIGKFHGQMWRKNLISPVGNWYGEYSDPKWITDPWL